MLRIQQPVVASGEPPALQCRTPSRHHLELQDRRDYTPADRAARTCWEKEKITRAPRERETRTHLKEVSPEGYVNSELRDFQISSIRPSNEIGNMIEEAVDLGRKINLEVNSNDDQKVLDSHNQELTIDELIEMLSKSKPLKSSPRRLNDR
ncbi:hypothetical protein TNCV_722841 [Trichonephila clavipes]|nr:hypothetical protein TNCV_722841 [Trichonephila clavipes]